MTTMRSVVLGIACAAQFAACSNNAFRTQTAGGDIDVNALTASRTVVVSMHNSYPTTVQVFTIIGEKSTSIANVRTDGVQTVALDPSLFPGTSFSLQIVPETGPAKRLGPFHLSKGQTAHLFITPDLDSARVEIRPTVP